MWRDLPAVAMLVLAAVLPARADACSCTLQEGTHEEQVAQSLDASHAVFVARLTHSALKPNRQDRHVYEDAQFEVLEVFKGDLRRGQTVRVYQAVSAGSCGRSSTNDPVWLLEIVKPGQPEAAVKVSREWLVYADSGEPYLLGACTRSAPLSAGGDADVKVLRKLGKATPKSH
jgi:hypothetical protein